jgi:DNA-binding transcriptional ArsR family regulator
VATLGSSNGQARWHADTRWFHMLRAMVSSGDVARFSGAAVKLYMVIKAATDLRTGEALIDQATLRRDAGLSKSHLYRGLLELREAGYLETLQRGRQTAYKITEKIPLADLSGTPAGQASWAYVPGTMSLAMREVSEVVKRELLGDIPVVYITLQVNIAQDQASVINMQECLDRISDPELRDTIMRAFGRHTGSDLP